MVNRAGVNRAGGGWYGLHTLHRKGWRDLWALRSQAIAIGLVITSATMTLLIAVMSLDALRSSQQQFYAQAAFADLFVQLTRAPEPLAERLRAVPGVQEVETRIQVPVRIEVPGFADPIRGIALSLPEDRAPRLHRLYLHAGTVPAARATDQVVVSDAFAHAHGLQVGDPLHAVIEGHAVSLRVVGVAVSPEFVYQGAPTDVLPDPLRYGIFWMNRNALADWSGLRGAFNSVLFSLQAGVSAETVVPAVDTVLAPFGGRGATLREDQHSHRFLQEELNQLRVQAILMPGLFLLVAAFLLHDMLHRLLLQQRSIIAILKTLGYSDAALTGHYLILTGWVVMGGYAVGVGLGYWAGTALGSLYHEYFRFPEMHFQLRVPALLLAAMVVGGAAGLGSLRAVRQGIAIAPATAMRPQAPRLRQVLWLERGVPLQAWGPVGRMILRNLLRQPVKTLLSLVGIALAMGLLVTGAQQWQAVETLLDLQFRQIERMDLRVHFSHPLAPQVAVELQHLPGVIAVETYRTAPVQLHAGPRSHTTVLQGLEPQPHLRQLLDRQGQPQVLPPEGLLMTDYLLRDLGLQIGDVVWVEFQEGARRVVRIPVVGAVDEPLGVGVYLQRAALNQWLREGPAVNGAWLWISHDPVDALFERLGRLPHVVAVGWVALGERNLRAYLADTLLGFALAFVALAGSLAFAVVYNHARILLEERWRDLVTLEVLGYSRRQVSSILLGEILWIVLLALPVGGLFGSAFTYWLTHALSQDRFRLPWVFVPSVHAYAAMVILLASAVAIGLVLRRYWQTETIRILKTVT